MEKIKTITILGGGSAGWMCAAALAKNLPRDNFQIKLIESKTIPTVGVGEATILNFYPFMRLCGFKESDWFDYCEGTYKSGIVYTDWIKKGTKFWHPFGTLPRFDNNRYNLFDILNSTTLPIHSEIHTLFQFYKKCVLDNKKSTVENAYHINASRLADFLRKSVDVEHRYGTIVNVRYNDSGVESIVLDTGEEVESDLFIDALGFRSIFKQKDCSYKFIDKKQYTPCNAAIAGTVSYTDKIKEQHPYTRAHCTPYGWMWIIPTANRIGTGMVYNKDISDPCEVESYYKEFWGEENIQSKKLNHISFNPGYYSNPWNKNVVSIGLASGFVEPLESSGIAFIIDGTIKLLGRIRKGFYTNTDIDNYNTAISLKYEETFDFISLHYVKTERKEDFWRYVNLNFQASETLNYRIKYVQNNRFDDYNLDEGAIFAAFSWLYLINQFTGIKPKGIKLQDSVANALLESYLKEETS